MLFFPNTYFSGNFELRISLENAREMVLTDRIRASKNKTKPWDHVPMRHVRRTLTKHPKCFQSPNLIWWGGGDRMQHRFLPYTFVGSDSIPKEEQKEINRRLLLFSYYAFLLYGWRGQSALYFCSFFFSFPSRDYTYESQGLHSDITTPPTQVFSLASRCY